MSSGSCHVLTSLAFYGGVLVVTYYSMTGRMVRSLSAVCPTLWDRHVHRKHASFFWKLARSERGAYCELAGHTFKVTGKVCSQCHISLLLPRLSPQKDFPTILGDSNGLPSLGNTTYVASVECLKR